MLILLGLAAQGLLKELLCLDIPKCPLLLTRIEIPVVPLRLRNFGFDQVLGLSKALPARSESKFMVLDLPQNFWHFIQAVLVVIER